MLAASRTAIAVTDRRDPNRPTSGPDSGSAISEPTAIADRIRPSRDGSRCRWARTCGIRDAQLEKAKPSPAKTA
jgi:hypothetical protein